MEKTLVLVKPDGVDKGVVGDIISRFEKRGLKLIALKMLRLAPDVAKLHYHEHQDKPFFVELIDFITSGPLVAMVLEGDNAVQAVRNMMGPTNPGAAAPGTIRGDYALRMSSNVVHGSDSITSANREIAIFFGDGEVYSN